jgi:hypothetical protein
MWYEGKGANEIAHEDTWTLGVSCLRSIFAMPLGSPVTLMHLSSRSVGI